MCIGYVLSGVCLAWQLQEAVAACGKQKHITHTPPKDTQGKQTSRRRSVGSVGKRPQNKDNMPKGHPDRMPDMKLKIYSFKIQSELLS